MGLGAAILLGVVGLLCQAAPLILILDALEAGRGLRPFDIAALTAGALGAGLCVFLGFKVRESVIRPMRQFSGYMAGFANAEYDQAPPYQDRVDELGQMARAIETFRQAVLQRRTERLAKESELHAYEQSLLSRSRDAEALVEERIAIIDALSDGLERLAIGDLAVRLEDQFPPGFDQLRIDFNASMEALGKVMESILEATEAVSFGAAELSRAAEKLSSRTDQQAELVRNSSNILVGLKSGAGETSRAAARVLDVMEATRGAAERSSRVMTETTEAMTRIEGSSAEIGRISSVIDEIAFQTSLLAINAGVEAARAGDAGRGFAVVATEVRALAQRSAEAAREIKQLVARAETEVAAGGAQVAETVSTLSSIVSGVVNVHQMVAGIAESSQHQVGSISAISDAVGLIDQITQNNVAMVAEATDASMVLADEAKGLTASISRFKAGAVKEEAGRQATAADDEIARLFG